MSENNGASKLMSMGEMGFSANAKGNMHYADKAPVISQVGKTIDKGSLGRLEKSDYAGSAGTVDNVLRFIQALAGRDVTSKEAKGFIKWIKESKDEFRNEAEGFLDLEAEEQIKRMSAGDENAQQALEALFKTHKAGSNGEMASLGARASEIWKEIDALTAKQYETDKGTIDEYMKGAEQAKTETFNSLWKLWELQEKKDLVNRTANYVNSSDRNRDENPSGKGSRRKPLEGGLIRRTIASLKSIPRGVGERYNTVAVGLSEARNLAALGGLSELKNDALSRTQSDSLKRAEMFVRGIITKEELGIDGDVLMDRLNELLAREDKKITSGEKRDKRYLDRIGKLKSGGKVAEASDSAKMAFYDNLYSGMESDAKKRYVDNKSEWKKYALKAEGGFTTGLLPAPLTEIAMKLAALGIDGTMKVVKGVDGAVSLVVESVDQEIADFALRGVAEATVAKELAAKQYMNGSDSDRSRHSANVRAAETIWQEKIIAAARAAGVIDFSQESPALSHLPGSLIVEGADLALGGVSTSELTGKLIGALAKKNERLLSAKSSIANESENLGGEDFQEARDLTKEQVDNIFSDLSDQFEDWDSMSKWMTEKQLAFNFNLGGLKDLLNKSKFTKWINEVVDLEKAGDFKGLPIREKMLKAVGYLSDPDAYKGEWGRILNAGSARRTKSEVLGLEKHGGGETDNRQGKLSLFDQMVVLKKKLTDAANFLSNAELNVQDKDTYEKILEDATMRETATAIEKWLKIQKDRMKRRESMDDMWESLPKVATAAAGAFVATFAYQFIGNHFHDVVNKLGIDLSDTQDQLKYAKSALDAAADSANFVSEQYASTHQDWAQQAGQASVDGLGSQANELQKDIFSGKVKEAFAYGMSLLSGISTLATVGYAGARVLVGAATPFADKSHNITGFMDSKAEVQ